LHYGRNPKLSLKVKCHVTKHPGHIFITKILYNENEMNNHGVSKYQ